MSTKYPSPLLGYNNNVRHKGRVFHIQTEDSGAKYGHIITHLFMDGGRILKSVKTSYTEYVGSERMSEIVREMMKQQHKAMFIALRDGKFDAVADGAASASTANVSAVSAEVPAAGAVSLGPSPPVAGSVGPVPPKAGPSASSPKLEADRTMKYASQSIAAMIDEEAPPTIKQTAASSSEIKLDVGAIERAAAAVAAPSEPLLRDSGDLPPPPANLFREKGTGRYRSVTPPPVDAVSAAPEEETPAAAAGTPRPPTPSNPALRSPAAGPTERRYAPTRPASIFGQARPAQGKSIFGNDLISDKSLDEVILSYLAEDLDEKK
jgi:hypothetical protein